MKYSVYDRIDFFEGDVFLAGQGIFNAKYSIVNNGAVIKVKNSAHVRMIFDQIATRGLPFTILAPMHVVTVVSGIIPNELISKRPISYCLSIRNQYQGF